MIIFSSFGSVFSLCALFLMTSNHFAFVESTAIQISNTLGTTTFNTKFPGQSTILVNYNMDVSTLGSLNSASDFYVLQFFQDGANCNVSSSLNFTGLAGATEPAISGNTSTTTLVNTADWPRGDTTFCLRMQLMLRMLAGENQLWHQMDFKMTVSVSFNDGNATVTYNGTSVADSSTFESAGSQTGTGEDVGVAPTFTTSVGGTSPYAYGTEIPITVGFVHPLDVFTYSVDIDNVIPVSDDAGTTQLKIGNNAVALRTKSFQPNFNFANRIIGTLTITLPLVVYQDTSVQSVKIKIPVSWKNNNAQTRDRNLRTLQQSETSGLGTYTGPPTGVENRVVELELEPYTDASGAIVGFTIKSVVSTVCVGATALLM